MLGDDVGGDEQQRPERRGRGQCDTRRSGEPARDLRGGERDEGDRPRGGGGDRGQGDGAGDEQAARGLEADAEGAGRVVAQLQLPLRRREPHQRHERDDDDRRGGKELRPADGVQGSRAPDGGAHRDLASRPQHQVGAERDQHRVHADADDDEPEAEQPPAVGQRVDRDGGQQPTGERPGGGGREATAEEDDRGDAARVRAGLQSDDVGAGEGVAGERLEDGPGCAHRRTEQHRGQHAREPPVEDDGGGDPVLAAGQRRQDLGERQGQVPEGEGEERQREDDERQDAGDDHTPRVEAERDRPPAEHQHAGPEVHPARGHSVDAFARRTSAIRTGAPTKAATMPTGSSPGNSATRPMTSAISTSVGARRSESAMIQR